MIDNKNEHYVYHFAMIDIGGIACILRTNINCIVLHMN